MLRYENGVLLPGLESPDMDSMNEIDGIIVDPIASLDYYDSGEGRLPPPDLIRTGVRPILEPPWLRAGMVMPIPCKELRALIDKYSRTYRIGSIISGVATAADQSAMALSRNLAKKLLGLLGPIEGILTKTLKRQIKLLLAEGSVEEAIALMARAWNDFSEEAKEDLNLPGFNEALKRLKSMRLRWSGGKKLAPGAVDRLRRSSQFMLLFRIYLAVQALKKQYAKNCRGKKKGK